MMREPSQQVDSHHDGWNGPELRLPSLQLELVTQLALRVAWSKSVGSFTTGNPFSWRSVDEEAFSWRSVDEEADETIVSAGSGL